MNFFSACSEGRMETVQTLVQEGTDVSALGGPDNASGLYYAAAGGHLDVCSFLVKNCPQVNLEEKDTQHGRSPLYKACYNGHLSVAEFLVDNGADINTRNNQGSSAVLVTAENGHLEVLKYLINKGANINIANKEGSTPLMMACEENSIEVVKLLVKAGANLNFQDINGRTALSLAVRLDCVNLLLEGGADVDLIDSGGFSPLCYASKYGREEIAARLIEAGADPDLSGWNGNNSLHLAAWGGNYTLFSNSVWFNNVCGSAEQINKPNHYGYTPLHLAALGNHTSTVQFLLGHGADINLQTNFGDTPLHCAVMGGNQSCIGSITKASNLDGSLKNVYGLTAADLYSQQYPDQSLPEMFREKVNLTDACQLSTVIPAKRFVEVAKLKESSISLKNVKLIKREHFLKAGEIPHYNECELKKWHFTAEDVKASHKVLFLSHRWGSKEHPDPDGAQYYIAVNFLNSSKGRDIYFIWADYSCICQNKESDLFLEHLKNIPTAVWTATHFLIIPKLVQVAGVLVTHLKDYLGRGWCVLEAMAGVMTGTECHLGFQVGKHTSYEKFDRPEGAASNLGFYQSMTNVSWLLHREEHPDFTKARGETQGVLWNIVEPCAILGLLIKICNSTRSEVQDFVQKALNLALNLEDIQSAPEEITQIWNMMGECEVEADKVPVINLMIFIGYYSLYMPRSSETDSNSFGTEESKETEVKEEEQRTAEEEPVTDQKVECTCDLM